MDGKNKKEFKLKIKIRETPSANADFVHHTFGICTRYRLVVFYFLINVFFFFLSFFFYRNAPRRGAAAEILCRRGYIQYYTDSQLRAAQVIGTRLSISCN